MRACVCNYVHNIYSSPVSIEKWRRGEFEWHLYSEKKRERLRESDRSRAFCKALNFSAEWHRHHLKPIPVPFLTIFLKGSESVMGLFLVPDYPILAAQKHSSVEQFARVVRRDLCIVFSCSFSSISFSHFHSRSTFSRKRQWIPLSSICTQYRVHVHGVLFFFYCCILPWLPST